MATNDCITSARCPSCGVEAIIPESFASIIQNGAFWRCSTCGDADSFKVFPSMTDDQFISDVHKIMRSAGDWQGLKDSLWDLADRFEHRDCEVYLYSASSDLAACE